MNKIYISDLHTPLGYHLVDLLRNDHQSPSEPRLIIGSSELDSVPHVYQTINFSSHSQVACRAILDCDLIILSLDSPSHEAEVIIKFLESSHSILTKTLRVICISSVMNWEGLKAYELQRETEKEKIMNAAIDQNNWKYIVWTDADYQKRIPSNFYIRNYELENLLLKLNKFPNIKATIIASGLRYGRQNLFLQHEILQALSGQSLQLIGGGDNLIPLTNYEHLLQSINILIPRQNVPYTIVCDEVQYTQKQVKQLINEVTDNSSALSNKQCFYLLKKECDWSINLKVKSSFQSKQGKSFQQYAREQLLSNFCDYNDFKPKQYFASLEKYEEKGLQELMSDLKGTIYFILQEDIDRIDEEIIAKMTPPEPQGKKINRTIGKPSSALQERQKVHYYREALEQLLHNRKFQNFIIICREHLINFVNKDLIFSNLTEIVQAQLEEELSQAEGKLVFRSDEYYLTFSLPKATHDSANFDINLDENQLPMETNERYLMQPPIRKDEQLILLNQYLLDNVLSPVSQAKFAMKAAKKTPTLHNFIEELKAIQARNNSRNRLLTE